MHGYTLNTTDAPNPHTKPNLANNLKRFRHATQRMADLAMNNSDAKLFRGKDGMKPQMTNYGINTLLAILPFTIHLTPAARQYLAIQVIRSQRRMPIKRAQEQLRKKALVPLKALRTKGRVQWMEKLRWKGGEIYTTTPGKHADQATQSAPSDGRPPGLDGAANGVRQHSKDPAVPSESVHTLAISPTEQGISEHQVGPPGLEGVPTRCRSRFKCPRCTNAIDPTKRKAMTTSTLDSKTWCKQCKRSIPVHQWICACGVPWHQCHIHKQVAHQRQSAETHTPMRRGEIYRRVDIASQHIDDWLDHTQPKRPRNEDTVDLGTHYLPSQPRVHLLGPTLKRKFPHLL